LTFRQEDALQAELEETDFLFVDTEATGEQPKELLARHAAKVRRYLAMHGTNDAWAAVEGLLAEGTFVLKRREQAGRGLAVLERMSPTASS
jgi:hypothetical protein